MIQDDSMHELVFQLHKGWPCFDKAKVTIPNSVTCIGTSAFSGCRSLSSVAQLAKKTEAVFSPNFGRISWFNFGEGVLKLSSLSWNSNERFGIGIAPWWIQGAPGVKARSRNFYDLNSDILCEFLRTHTSIYPKQHKYPMILMIPWFFLSKQTINPRFMSKLWKHISLDFSFHEKFQQKSGIFRFPFPTRSNWLVAGLFMVVPPCFTWRYQSPWRGSWPELLLVAVP